MSFLVGNHREPLSINTRLFLPIIPIGIVAHASVYAFVGQPLSKQLYMGVESARAPGGFPEQWLLIEPLQNDSKKSTNLVNYLVVRELSEAKKIVYEKRTSRSPKTELRE